MDNRLVYQRSRLAGKKLRRLRQRLGLALREVTHASEQVAAQRRNPAFKIGVSRLHEIETKGAIPSIYRLYSLACIYRYDLSKMLRWYGVELNNLRR